MELYVGGERKVFLTVIVGVHAFFDRKFKYL